MEKKPCFLVGKLSSQFNPCLNTCLEASWCIVFPQQAAAAASACSLHHTAMGSGLVTQAPAAPGVKQQLCSLSGRSLALLERMAVPAFPTAQTRCLWYCESVRRAQPQVPPCPCSGSPPPWPLGKEQPCSCLLLAGHHWQGMDPFLHKKSLVWMSCLKLPSWSKSLLSCTNSEYLCSTGKAQGNVPPFM